MLVVEDARPGVVGVEGNCALVVTVVAPIAVADVIVVAVVANVVAAIVVVIVPKGVVDVDLVVVVDAAVVDAFVVTVVGRLAAVQVVTGRLEQGH